VVVVFDPADTADSRPDCNTHALSILFRDLDAAVLDRLASRRQTIMDKFIHLPGIFLGNILGYVETVDRAAEVHTERLDVKMCDRLNPALTCEDIRPGLFNRMPHGRDHSEPGYNNPSSRHVGKILLLRSDGEKPQSARIRLRPSLGSDKKISCCGYRYNQPPA